ncbi:hypothetical protein BJX99DRAFT_255845 [Aspergillus californicus]
MDWNHLAEKQGQTYFAAWLDLLGFQMPALPLQLASKHRPGDHKAITASEPLISVAPSHLTMESYQRNDAIDDEQDCKRKYIARCLFRRIARTIETESGPFRLYCDDYRPSNVLVSPVDGPNFNVAAVIDWEYTYVAPNEFTHVAPWWLLFEVPEAWEEDLNVFIGRYTPRLRLFLAILRACEDKEIQKGALTESQRLSGRMAGSLDTGLFWFCLAARKGYMLDDIYWTFLDERYFGPLRSLDDRLSLLSDDELAEMDGFVARKTEQIEEERLDEHLTYDQYVDL